MSRLFVTGASGFVGRRFLARVAEGPAHEVVGLTRDAARLAGTGATPVEGDVAEPGGWADALEGIDAVVHLAAATGAAKAAEHWRVNARGTELLLHAAARAGVERFVFVSSIATRFDDVSDYPYARAKRRAEEAVRASGLAWTIVRPTLVVGPGGGAWESLAGLARRRWIPIPGSGRAVVQPVWVGDVADVLVEAVEGRWIGEAVDVGGAERLPIEALLARIRERRGQGDPAVLHVPARRLLPVLGWLDRRGAPLPVTAGPLRSFYEDGVVGPGGVLGPTSLDAMIDRALEEEER